MYLDEKDRKAIISNRSLMENLVKKSENLFIQDDLEASLAVLELAAYNAWKNHTGKFTDEKMENLIAKISQKLDYHFTGRSHESSRPKRRIVHVLSQAHGLGGHTRLVWRWIKNDTSSVHDVIITDQMGRDVPKDLLEACQESGGCLILIPELSRVNKIKNIRDGINKDCHAIVLHIHPYDVLSAVAVYQMTNVIYLNHADHVFWVGLSATNRLVNIRLSGEKLSNERRLEKAQSSCILPIPLDHKSYNKVSRHKEYNGRKKLISIASDYKYKQIMGESGLFVFKKIVDKLPDVEIHIVGLNQNKKFEECERIIFHGESLDLSEVYQGADIYIDSYPFASLTSLLEAGMHGIPVLSLQLFGEPSPLSTDDVALESDALCQTEDDLIFKIRKTLENNVDIGFSLSNRIKDVHTGNGWLDFLNAVYANIPSKKLTPSDKAEINLYDSAVLQLQRNSNSTRRDIKWRVKKLLSSARHVRPIIMPTLIYNSILKIGFYD